MQINTNPITALELQQILPVIYEEKSPTILWGDPGIGKSSIVNNFCSENNLQLIDCRLSQLSPEDLRGLPYFNHKQKTTTWYTPEFLPTTGKGILFLDELPQADHRLQSAAFQLILDRRIGDYHLPPGWGVVAAGNYKNDDTLFEFSPALNDRFTHLLIQSDAKDWIKWAEKNQLDKRVITFIKLRPEFLNSHGSLIEKSEDEFIINPTPRSWEAVSNILKYESQLSKDNLAALIWGRVGYQVYSEFIYILNEIDSIPDINILLSLPEKECIQLIDGIKSIYGLYGVVYSMQSLLSKKEDIEKHLKLLVSIAQSNQEHNLEIATVGFNLVCEKIESLFGLEYLYELSKIKDFDKLEELTK